MRNVTVAARYARALMILVQKRGETAAALDDLKALLPVFGASSPLSRVLATPRVRPADKRKAVQAALEGRTLRSVAVFVDLLLRKKRLGEFDTIVQQYEALVERQQGIQRAHVTSAVPLQRAETDRLHAQLEAMTESKIRMTSEVDPDLLGGVHVRIGDRVIDRSVKTLLETIERQLLEVSV